MKLFHLSDLHLGKSVHGFSMIEDQEYIIMEILDRVYQDKPNAILVSGDIFDRTIPSTEALQLFDKFLMMLVANSVKVYIISGNHDSADRLSFGAGLFNRSGVYFSRVYDRQLEPYVLEDKNTKINIYLLPFIKPAYVRRYFPDITIDTYTEAVDTVVSDMNINEQEINILLAHQFVTGASTSESEEHSVGGMDNVDGTVFGAFDYVALGHLHRPQHIARNTLRYSGSPLKYSFSEVNDIKSITALDITSKDLITIDTYPLVPKRDLLRLSGRYLELSARDFYSKLDTNAYYQIILTDEEDQLDVFAKLRSIYPNLMTMEYSNMRTRVNSNVTRISVDHTKMDPIDIFSALYIEQNGQPFSEVQREYLNKTIKEVFEEEEEL